MALGRMCKRGFQSLSHNVCYFSPEFQTIPILGTLNKDASNREFINSVADRQPDLILVIKGYELDRLTLERIHRVSEAKVVNWNPDNPFQVRSQKREATTYLNALPAYDVVFTWGRFLIDRLESRGATNVEYLPFGWDRTLHKPAEPDERFDCQVMFLGIWSSKRECHLKALTDFDFHLRGNYWKLRCWDFSLRQCHRGGKLGGRDYARAMSSADIVVNVVADHNVPAHNMRTFEVPATGTLLVTTRTEGQQRFFREGTDVVMYEGPDELREKIEYYLKHDQVREQVANQGHETVQMYSYETRMNELLRKVYDS
jgi:spore maturation protein CgeB